MRTNKSLLNYFFICAANILTQFTMIIVSGAWWDDWKFYVNDYADLKSHYISAGRLDAYYIIYLINKLPAFLFHLIVLICFMLSSIFIYAILKQLLASQSHALMITILYSCIPVNDARIMKCVFPYTFSHFLFWLAAYLLIKIFKAKNNAPNYLLRGLILILFFISFSTNSLLIFYIIPLGITWFMERQDINYNSSCRFKTYVKYFIKHLDFYILPVLFYLIKRTWFAPGKLYEDYNLVTLKKCLNALKILPKSSFYNLKSILRNWGIVIKETPTIIIIFIVIMGACYFVIRNRKTLYTPKHCHLLNFIIGFFLYLSGQYPYVVIRQNVIETTGLNGRDSLLLCLGAAIMIYSFINLLPIPVSIQYGVIFCILICSTFHFNNWYMTYQRDYYEQVALQQIWQKTNDVKNGKTFIYISNGRSPLNTERFYTLNAMSKQIYKDTSRFFSIGIDGLSFITTDDQKELFIHDVTYCMNQYTLNDVKISGVMIADYNLSEEECYQLRLTELINPDAFLNNITRYIEYKFISINKDLSTQLLKMYNNGELTNNDELLTLLGL